MIKKDDEMAKSLKKKIPSFKDFNKNIELEFLQKFDDMNDDFQFIEKYSNKYYLLKEFFIERLKNISFRHYQFREYRKKRFEKYLNYKKYIQKEDED